MDGLCVLNDGGEFGNSFLKIYTEELELNAEHQGNHACFLKLDTSVKTTSLLINCSIKEIHSHLQYFKCLILTVTFHKIYFIQQLRKKL